MGGKTGYCKLCHSEHVSALNKLIKNGASFGQAIESMAPKGVTFSKATFYGHKGHITSPLLTAVEEARKNPVIKPTSNRAVLEAIRDIGMNKVMEDPDSVTVNHALRAASILAEKESRQDSVLVVLAKALQGSPEVAVLEQQSPTMLETKTSDREEVIDAEYQEA
jgi:hypothetical protein